MWGICEFCDNETNLESTQFNGYYCIDCYKLLIKASKEAVKKLSIYKNNTLKRVVTKEDLENSLSKLINRN